MIKLALRLAATGLVALVVALPHSFAATPAGSIIRNQAEASYFDPGRNRSFSVTSTIATVRVRSAPDFELRLEGTRQANPGEQVVFPHELVNTGNESDTYFLSIQTLIGTPALEVPAIYIDVNGNGEIDSDEPQVTQTPVLEPGQTVSLLLSGWVPAFAARGQAFAAQVRAVSNSDPSNVQNVVDTATVSLHRRLQITKNVLPVCSTPIQPGSLINYSITMLNVDDLATYTRNYTIDGVMTSGYVITDVIPANTTLVAGDAMAVSPQAALTVVQDASAPKDIFRGYDQYRESDLIGSVGLFVPVSAMTPNQSGSFAFRVRVNGMITPGTVITNAVAVDLDGDGRSDVVSNPTCNTVDPRGVDATLRFLEPALPVRREITAQALAETGSGISALSSKAGPRHPIDADYADAPVYRLDSFPGYLVNRDGVYLEAMSTALNNSAAIQETRYGERFIRVKVESRETGDILYVRLLETGPNTGLFRALVPFRLSVSESGSGRDCDVAMVNQCVLRSVSADRLRATIFDPGTQRELIDAAVVDPQGIVFDSTTLAPVSGAEVMIVAADGAIARDPDSDEPLGVQVTGAGGRFTIPRLADGQYAIAVTPPSDYSFPSIVAPDVFAGRRDVWQASYGAAGYLGAGSGLFDAGFANTPPVIDVPIDPDLTLGQIALDKSVDRKTVAFGDTLTYMLTVQNNAGARLDDVFVSDTPAPGLRLVEGSARLNGDPLAVVRGPEPRLLTFPLGNLEPTAQVTLTYTMQVGPEARPGTLENSAFAIGTVAGFVEARSPVARAGVRLTDEGLLSDRAYLIGSVWGDLNANGLRDEDEIGLPGARIWLEDGTWVETDELGRYSLYGLQPGLRIARLDEKTLPTGYLPAKSEISRNLSGHMRFVDLTAGDLYRADFPLACSETAPCGRESGFAKTAGERAARLSPNAMLDQALSYEGLIGETRGNALTRRREQLGSDGDVSNGVVSVSGVAGFDRGESRAVFAAPDMAGETNEPVEGESVDPLAQLGPDPEQAAATLGRIDVKAGAWLWPLPDATTGERYARDGRVMVAVRSGIEPVLYVDGVAVSAENLGALVENREQGATVAAWYGVDFAVGPHDLEVRGMDTFGNERVLSSVRIVRPGKAERLLIEPPVEKVAADGHSRAQLTLRALDALSAPSMGMQFLTIAASVPGSDVIVKIDSEDVQPSEPGHQIRLRDGAAVINLIAPSLPGEVMVIATDGGDLTATTPVRFASEVRDLIAVGVVDLNGRVFDLSNDLEPADETLFPTQMKVDGRTAVFLKGQIKGGALLTFAYDSEKSSQGGLFRDIDPEAYYPIYGDASEKGYEAQSRSKLYVRIEKGDSAIMWGDFRSDAFGEEHLVRARRALTGVNATTQQGDWTLNAFAAETSRRQRTERVRGRGLALDITLPGAPLVDGSEVLTVEVRDRNNPGLLVSEETLVRFVDYLLDDETGRLILKAPLPSMDEFGNPVFLLATYEADEEVADSVVAGVRARLDAESGSIWAGVTYDETQAEIDRRVYASVGAEHRFAAGRVYAEAGVSENHTDGVADTMGEAVRLGVEADVLGGSLVAEFAQADSDFVNSDAPIFAGRREARATYQRTWSPSVSSTLGGSYSEDLDTGATRSIADAQIVAQAGEWVLGVGPRFTKQDEGSESVDYVSAVLRAQRSFEIAGRAASGGVELERALDDNRTRVTVTGDYMVRDDTRLYATHRLLDELPQQTAAQGLTGNQLGLGQQQTAVGIESRFLPNTDLYGEWREAGGLDSRSGEAAYGLRSQWDLVEGLSFAPQFEYVQTFDNADSADALTAEGDSVALSLAIADRRFENSRRSARVEGRTSERSTFLSTRIGWAERFNPVLTGAVKLDAARDNIAGADDMERLRLTLGSAYRPADAEEWDLIALYQWLSEDEGGENRTAHIVSAHSNRQFGTDWTVSGRAVAKWEVATAGDNSAQLLGGRVIRRITHEFDAELRGSVKAVGWGDAYQSSLGIAGIYQPRDDVRLTLGYNFQGFRDRDLDPNGYDAQGVYWGIALALDEDWFGWLRPDGNRQRQPEPLPLPVPVLAKAPVAVAEAPAPTLEAAPLRIAESLLQNESRTEIDGAGDTKNAAVCTLEEPRFKVYFEWDSADLTRVAETRIGRAAKSLKAQTACGYSGVRIVGHTDTSGPESYNQLLSVRRAHSVAEAFRNYGIDPQALEVSGKGESQPIVGESAAMSRRAEIIVEIR